MSIVSTQQRAGQKWFIPEIGHRRTPSKLL